MRSKFIEAFDDPFYRQVILDSLCKDIENVSDFRDCLEYFIDNKIKLFEDFNQIVFDGEFNLIDYILPSIRRVWYKIYKVPPDILKGNKLELYRLLFNIDDFTKYLLDILPKVIKSLENFTNLDRSVETLNLIVEDYSASLFYKVLNNYTDIDSAIKILKRDNVINKILK